MEPTHVLESRIARFIGPRKGIRDFVKPLQILDGTTRFSLSLFKLPHPGLPEDFSKQELAEAQQRFIQAGGSSQAMTVEVREQAEGGYWLYVVGRATTNHEAGLADVEISVGDLTVLVHPNEVFDAHGASELFFFYYLHDSTPVDGYELRKLKFFSD